MNPLNNKHLVSGVCGKPEISIVWENAQMTLEKKKSQRCRDMNPGFQLGEFSAASPILERPDAASPKPTAFFSGRIFDVVGQFKFKTFVADADADVDFGPTRKVPTLVR